MIISQNSDRNRTEHIITVLEKKTSGCSKLDEANCYQTCAVHQELQEPCNQLGKVWCTNVEENRACSHGLERGIRASKTGE